MSLTISRAEGVTVYTLHSNSKSKWPLCCQILGTMCYTPWCSVSQRLKQELGCALTALATIQIAVGIMNLVFGTLSTAIYNLSEFGIGFFAPGGVIAVVGLLCILAVKFPSPCVVVLIVLMNIVSAGFAIAATVLYSVDLQQKNYKYLCYLPTRRDDSRYYWTTPSPARKAEWEQDFQRKLELYTVCEENRAIRQKIHAGLDILMIVFAVLQLCVTISWCVLSIKALRGKKADAQDDEDPELRKSLIDQEIPKPVC